MNVEDHPALRYLEPNETPLMVLEGYLITEQQEFWWLFTSHGVCVGRLGSGGWMSPALASHHRNGHISEATLTTLRNLRSLHQ